MNRPTQLRRLTLGVCRRAARAALAVVIALVLAIAVTGSAQAQYSYSLLYSFTGGTDGGDPRAALVQDAQGNLYGTTSAGGAYGAGTVFRVDTTGKETVLYSFTGGADGGDPGCVLLDAQGNLYGATESGGAYGPGTVFKLDTAGAETVLYSFTGGADGGAPLGGVVQDGQGNLYGSTMSGGTYNWGTVFKVDTTGTETVLHSFGASGDGVQPSGIVQDGQGNLYGATYYGGAYGKNPGQGGTVFKVDMTTGQETVLYSFPLVDRYYPQMPNGGLALDAQGNLYGTTIEGNHNLFGTVFEVFAAGGGTLLWNFNTKTEGQNPFAGVVLDAQGNLYGTTSQGGSYKVPNGTVFELNLCGGGCDYETVLHNFSEKKGDGAIPAANLMLGGQGNLYGTTTVGGAYGNGTVFALLSSAAATTTTLTSAPNPSTSGEAVTFTAVVSGANGVPPDGETVSFMNRKTVLGTGTLSGGSATFITSTLKNGKTTVTAVYSGDVLFARSTSNAVVQVVTKPTR